MVRVFIAGSAGKMGRRLSRQLKLEVKGLASLMAGSDVVMFSAGPAGGESIQWFARA